MTFPPWRNSDHVVVSVSIDFSINAKHDAPFHRIDYDYSCADRDVLCDNLRDVPCDNIFKLSASTATSEFCQWVRLELMYIFLIVSIRSNLTHPLGFSSLYCYHRNHFFVCTNRINLLNLKANFRQANNRCRRVLEAAKLPYTAKSKVHHFPETCLSLLLVNC